jgi:translation elongation factor EF-4
VQLQLRVFCSAQSTEQQKNAFAKKTVKKSRKKILNKCFGTKIAAI